ncbi:MAG: hypothetical protein CSA81_01395 [Acidobacteria bacterium]|nr:MAG: hypothetical protein CSA81_01395 [Acidobacteriota bacterium]
MKKAFLITATLLFCFVLQNCDKKENYEPEFDRELIGEEIEFGRKAARYELWNEAIFRWEKVVKAEGENVKALNNLAVAYEAIGDFESARQYYEKALDYDEDVTALRNNYKRFLHFYKKHMRNQERLEKANEPSAKVEESELKAVSLKEEGDHEKEK